jgi:hypothetical protein
MNTHADKKQQHDSQAVANQLSIGQNGNPSSVQLVENKKESEEQSELMEIVNNSTQIKTLNSYQELANNSPRVKQQLTVQAILDRSFSKSNQGKEKKNEPVLQAKLLIGQNKKQANPIQKADESDVIQRVVRVAGAVVAAAAIPADTDAAAVATLTGWIGDAAEDLRFATWAEATEVAVGGAAVLADHRAVQWLRGMGWQIPRANIVNAALTAGNCHGLTFGAGGAAFIEFESIQEVIDLWNANGTPNILVCLLNGQVAHSATHTAAGWQQTLPEGPTFFSTLAILEGKYTCYALSNAGELAALQILATAQTNAYAILLAAALARFQPATQIPEGERTEAQNYMANWHERLADMQGYSQENENTINNWNEEVNDMEANP